MGSERRKFRRLRAPVYCRPAGVELLARHREPIDVSLGGIRVYSDEPYRVGELLKMEFLVTGAPPATYTAEIVWLETLPDGGPARFDVGLKFVDMEPDALTALEGLLGTDPGPPAESLRPPS